MSRRPIQGNYTINEAYLEHRSKYHKNTWQTDPVGKFNPIFHTPKEGEKYFKKTLKKKT